MPAKRAILRIELDTDAKNRLEEICFRRGMTQISMMSRVVNWFSRQNEDLQTAVLQPTGGESMPGLAKSLLKSLFASGK